MNDRQEDEIHEMHGLIHEMKPMLEAVVTGMKSIDDRLRANEILTGAHEVKLNLASDKGRWGGVFEFLSMVPTAWHVAISVVMFLIALGAVLGHSASATSVVKKVIHAEK